jgi:GNAT superfamily N-acetyltransferase
MAFGYSGWYDGAVSLTRVVDEAGLRHWHQIYQATEAYDYVALPADPIEELAPILTGPVAGEQVELWLAVTDEPVAAIRLRMPIHDNLTLATVALHVHPDHRRRGHARRALADTMAIARERGRSRLLCEVPTRTRHEDPAPGEALARSVGAQPLHAETRRLLDVSTVVTADLAAIHAEALEASVGYSTIAWRNQVPAEHVDDLAGLMGLMSVDSPQGELDLEPEIWDVERYRQREASNLARGRMQLCVGAREDRTGHIVGFTAFGIPTGGVDVGYQWETVVRSGHRGHRLGLLLKVVNLRQLMERMPEVRYVNTWNAEENVHMVAVNEKLGFQPMETWTEWGLELGG